MRTIDSLAANLAHRLPVLSSLGAATGVVDDATATYEQAAERFIERHISKISAVSQKIDNRLETLRGLLVSLLSVRDQWVRYVAEDFSDDRLREVLEQMLCDLLQSRVQALCAAAPPGLGGSMVPILKRGAAYLRELEAVDALDLEDPHRAVIALADALDANGGQLPGSEVDDIAYWCLVANFLLTTTGTPRRNSAWDCNTCSPSCSWYLLNGVKWIFWKSPPEPCRHWAMAICPLICRWRWI